jgi:hypothetical protein
LGDAAVIGVFAAAKEAKRLGLKTVVIGEGGDEAFGGYWLYYTFDHEIKEGLTFPNWDTIKRHFAAGFGQLPVEAEAKLKFIEAEIARRPDVPIDFVKIAMGWDRYKGLPNTFLWKNILGCRLNDIIPVFPFAHPSTVRFADTLPRSELVNISHPQFTLKIFLRKLALKLGLSEKLVFRPKSGFAATPTREVMDWLQNDLGSLYFQPLGKIDIFAIWSLAR